MNPNKIAAPVTADQLYQPFLVSYKTAAWDDYLISSGQARSGKAYYDTVPFPPDKDYSPFDYATCPDPKSAPKSNVSYGPPGSLAVNVSQVPGVCNPKSPAANPAPAPQAQPAAAKPRASSTTASTAPPQTPTVNPGQEIPGSSCQSIHARQMALNGVHLADLYCRQFFVAQKRRISRRTHRVQCNGRRRVLHNHQRWRHSDDYPAVAQDRQVYPSPRRPSTARNRSISNPCVIGLCSSVYASPPAARARSSA